MIEPPSPAGEPMLPGRASTGAAAQRDALLGPSAAPRSAPADPRSTAAESLACAAVLSCGAGYLDAFTFTGHGHSFASAMTGNMVLLGINLGHPSAQALDALYPLLAFALGAAIAHLLGHPGVRRVLPLPAYFAALLVETAVLCAVALLPDSFDDHILVAVVALTTAVQNTTFRNIGTRSYNSAIMTGNLQNLAKILAGDAWVPEKRAWRSVRELASVLASFIAGAAAGAAMTPRFGNLATLAPAALLATLAVVLAFAATERR